MIETEKLKNIREYYVVNGGKNIHPPTVDELVSMFDVTAEEIRASIRIGKWEDARLENVNRYDIARKNVEREVVREMSIDVAQELTNITTNRIEMFREMSKLVNDQMIAHLRSGRAKISELIKLYEILAKEATALTNDMRNTQNQMNEVTEEMQVIQDLAKALGMAQEIIADGKPRKVDYIKEGSALFDRLNEEE